jgi:hypothetical protein
MKPLLGGTMYWTVNPEFNAGISSGSQRNLKRTVDFVMLTTFEMDPDCTYAAGNRVSCQGKKNGVADAHGVLCVKAIKQRSKTLSPQYGTRHLKGPDGAVGECPYTWKSPRDPENVAICKTQQVQDSWLAGVECYSNVEPQYNNNHIPDNPNFYAKVGAENAFEVLQVHTDDDDRVFSRKVPIEPAPAPAPAPDAVGLGPGGRVWGGKILSLSCSRAFL